MQKELQLDINTIQLLENDGFIITSRALRGGHKLSQDPNTLGAYDKYYNKQNAQGIQQENKLSHVIYQENELSSKLQDKNTPAFKNIVLDHCDEDEPNYLELGLFDMDIQAPIKLGLCDSEDDNECSLIKKIKSLQITRRITKEKQSSSQLSTKSSFKMILRSKGKKLNPQSVKKQGKQNKSDIQTQYSYNKSILGLSDGKSDKSLNGTPHQGYLFPNNCQDDDKKLCAQTPVVFPMSFGLFNSAEKLQQNTPVLQINEKPRLPQTQKPTPVKKNQKPKVKLQFSCDDDQSQMHESVTTFQSEDFSLKTSKGQMKNFKIYDEDELMWPVEGICYRPNHGMAKNCLEDDYDSDNQTVNSAKQRLKKAMKDAILNYA